jgi:hypothetical protein
LNVSIGVGYGRCTAETPLAKAYKIEDDLLALGAISAPLTDETLMAVATEIGKRVEYSTIKDLVAAVEPIIEQDAGVTLNARALLTVEDDILATGDSVHCGWSVQAGVGYEVMDPYGGKRDPIFTISGDAALAPMPDSQLSLHAGMYGPFDIMNENTLTMNASYKYAIKSDVDLNLAYQYRRVLPEGQTAKDSQSASAILKFDLGGADVSVQLGLSKEVEATAWSKDITIVAGMSLF